MKFTVKKTDFLLNILSDYFKDTSITKIKKIIASGLILSGNTKLTKATTIINQGTELHYFKNRQVKTKEEFPYDILFEDEYLIAVNKPAGIVTHGIDSTKKPSLLKTVNKYIKENSKCKKRAFIIHRLDREVSGTILLAKNANIMQMVKDRWKETEKIYFALVEGTPEVAEGTLSSWLMQDKYQKMKSVQKSEYAEFAITHYKTVAKYEKFTLLEVSIETGKKNQIRVHLLEMGNPIVGDRKYGADSTYIRQIRLHSSLLRFIHPIKKNEVLIQCKLPKNFLMIKNENENY